MHRSVPIQSSLLLIDFFGSVIIWQSDKWLLANDIAPQKRPETFLPSTIEIAITSWLEISGNPCRLHIKLLSRVVLPRPRNRPLSTERKELPHPSPCTTLTTSTVAECQIFYRRIAFKDSSTVHRKKRNRNWSIKVTYNLAKLSKNSISILPPANITLLIVQSHHQPILHGISKVLSFFFKSCLIERMIRDMMQLCQPPPSFQTLGRPPGQLDRRMSATARCTSLHMCSVCIMCIGDLGNMPLTPHPTPCHRLTSIQCTLPLSAS